MAGVRQSLYSWPLLVPRGWSWEDASTEVSGSGQAWLNPTSLSFEQLLPFTPWRSCYRLLLGPSALFSAGLESGLAQAREEFLAPESFKGPVWSV